MLTGLQSSLGYVCKLMWPWYSFCSLSIYLYSAGLQFQEVGCCACCISTQLPYVSNVACCCSSVRCFSWNISTLLRPYVWRRTWRGRGIDLENFKRVWTIRKRSSVTRGFVVWFNNNRGTRWHSWLRHCAASRKMLDSIPYDVNDFLLVYLTPLATVSH
jgi:hypothetical protein